MPHAPEFLAGFNFIQGNQFASYVLSNVTSTHETIKRYQEYQYHITLVFTKQGAGTYEDLFQAVMSEAIQEHVIYGIRNPYRCIIDYPKYGDIIESSDGTVTYHLLGHSYRIHK